MPKFNDFLGDGWEWSDKRLVRFGDVEFWVEADGIDHSDFLSFLMELVNDKQIPKKDHSNRGAALRAAETIRRQNIQAKIPDESDC